VILVSSRIEQGDRPKGAELIAALARETLTCATGAHAWRASCQSTVTPWIYDSCEMPVVGWTMFNLAALKPTA
jgi:hypothetical protein